MLDKLYKKKNQSTQYHQAINWFNPTMIATGQFSAAEAAFLFTRVVALEGSISGEHGIGFAKAPYIPIELSPDEVALMKRVKAAFDPHGILNPGKMFD